MDNLICAVRDCQGVGKKAGYPVDSTGRKSDACFDRRSAEKRHKIDQITLAYLNPKKLLRSLERYRYKRDEISRELIANNLYSVERSAISEALTAFCRGDLMTSVQEWSFVLTALGYPRGENEIAAALNRTGDFNSRPRLSSQKTKIYNWEEVRQILLDSGDEEFASFLR